MKSPYETVVSEIYQNMLDDEESGRYSLEQFDKFLVWIVSFSVGTIVLLIGNMETAKKLIGNLSTKYIIALLTASLLFGIIYRITNIIAQYYDSRIVRGLKMAFNPSERLPNGVLEDLESYSFYSMAAILKNYGHDVAELIEGYEKADPEQKLVTEGKLKETLHKLSTETTEEYVRVVEFVHGKVLKAYNVSEKKFDKKYKHNNDASRYWFFKHTSRFSLGMSCLSFVTAVLLFFISYWRLN